MNLLCFRSKVHHANTKSAVYQMESAVSKIWTFFQSLTFLAILSLANNAIARVNNSTLTLYFGVYSSYKPTAMIKQFRSAMNVLEKQLSEMLYWPVVLQIEVQ